MSAHAPIQQAAANSQNHTNDICDPVVDVGAAIEAGLDEFDDTPICARANKDGHQAKAPRAGQREGERREGYEVHELVASLRRWGRCLQGPEHRDGQGERHNKRQGDIQVLAHPPGCIGRAGQRQALACVALVRGKVEIGSKSEGWGFR